MKALPTDNRGVTGNRRPGERACARMIIPALVFFLAGAALSAVWFSRGWHNTSKVSADAENSAALSDTTKAVLQHLDAPIEIRFYSSLDATSVPDTVQAFAGRVDQWLSQYEQAAGGRVKVVRYDSSANFSANAALADGIKAFNIEKGDGCYLGITVVCGGQKESLSQIVPEWEQALEPDVTRAIARAVASRPGAQPPARVDTASLAAVKKAIPNLDAVTVEDGAKILHDATLAQFQQAGAQMEAKVNEAEQRFIQSEGNQSEAAQQAAREQLLKIQAEGTRKLQEIAHDSHAQIAALQQLKKSSP